MQLGEDTRGFVFALGAGLMMGTFLGVALARYLVTIGAL